MANCVDEFMDNILARISIGPAINDDELTKMISDVESRMVDIKTKIHDVEGEVCVALESLNDHNGCQADPLAMHCFLNNVIQACERNVGREDFILNDLVSFCHRNCFALPPFRFETRQIGESELSLNTCIDDAEEHTSCLWQKIHSKLRNGIVKLLKAVSLPFQDNIHIGGEEKNKFYLSRRQHLFELLCTLYPFEDVWHIYCDMRNGQLENSNPRQIQSDVEKNVNYSVNIEYLQTIMNSHVMMIKEDTELLYFIKKEEKKLISLGNLLDCYTRNAEYHLKEFLKSYKGIQDKFNVNNVADTSSLFTATVVSDFSATDIRTFAKLFSLFDNWYSNLKKLKDVLFSSDENNPSSLVDDDSFPLSRGYVLWNWQLELEPFVPVFKKVIPSYVQCIFHVIMKKIDDDWATIMPNSDDKLFVSEQFLHYDGTYPLQVSSKLGTLISLISEVVFFLKYDQSEILKEISEVGTYYLIDALNEYIAAVKRSISFSPDNKGVNVDYLYGVIYDNAFIENQLNLWESFCGDQNKSLGRFHFVIKCLKEVEDDCVKVIIKYHLDIIKSSIVYDAHGNNWAVDAYFYEGERCSFTVQMWNFYVRGMTHDVFMQLPVIIAKRIVKEICTEMLVLFTARYTYVKVSYRKLKQFKADIIVLLSLYKWLLLYLVEEPSDYLKLEDSSFEMWHKLCNMLFYTVMVIASPISMIVDYFKNVDINSSNGELGSIQWFNLIGNEQFISEDPVLLLFEIIMKQPVVNLDLFAKLLALKHGKVPLLIWRYLEKFYEPIYLENQPGEWNDMFISSIVKKCCAIDKERFLQNVYFILLRTSQTSFMHFLASLIEGDTSKSFKASCMDQLPVWLELVTKDVNMILKRILLPCVDLLIHEEKLKSVPRFTFTNVQKLPCGCTTVPETDDKKFDNESMLLYNCLIVTLNMLVDNISCFPYVLWDVFAYIKGQPNVTASWTKQTQLGTKILACLLFNWLTMKENFQQLSDQCVISECSFTKIKDFAELLWHVVYNLTYDVTDNPRISMDIYKDMQNSSDVIMEKLSCLDTYCNREECKNEIVTDSDILENRSTSNIYFQTEDGCNSLKYVAGIIKLNEKPLRNLLENNLVLFAETSKEKDGQGVGHGIFDPIAEFGCIGEKVFDHNELLEMQFDWKNLIRVIPLSKMKALVRNRFEFLQESSGILNSDEISDVSEIKLFLD